MKVGPLMGSDGGGVRWHGFLRVGPAEGRPGISLPGRPVAPGVNPSGWRTGDFRIVGGVWAVTTSFEVWIGCPYPLDGGESTVGEAVGCGCGGDGARGGLWLRANSRLAASRSRPALYALPRIRAVPVGRLGPLMVGHSRRGCQSRLRRLGRALIGAAPLPRFGTSCCE